MSEDEDIELKLIRLRRLSRLLASRSDQGAKAVEERRSPVEELRAHLDEKGIEVLDEARELDPAVAERVAEALLNAVRSGRLESPIDAGALLKLFRSLGVPVKPSTSVKVLKDGEVKDLSRYLLER
ncbi:MAG: DNA-binding protein [Candidatus Caldarchaeales archaeon]